MPFENKGWHLDEVAAVAMQLEVMQVNDVGGDGVQEIPVVTNDHQGLLPAAQVLL